LQILSNQRHQKLFKSLCLVIDQISGRISLPKLFSTKSQTIHFAKLASFPNDVEETGLLGEVVVDQVDQAVTVNHPVNDAT